jgi:hypothetical protein
MAVRCLSGCLVSKSPKTRHLASKRRAQKDTKEFFNRLTTRQPKHLHRVTSEALSLGLVVSGYI